MSNKKREIVIKFSEINEEGIDKIDLRKYLKKKYGIEGTLLFKINNSQKKYLLPAVYSNKYGFIQLLLNSDNIILNELEFLNLETGYISKHIQKNTYPHEDVKITLIPNDFKCFLNIKDIKAMVKKNIELYSDLQITVIPFKNLKELIDFIGLNSFMSNYYMKEISWVNIKNFLLEESDENAILEDSFIEFFFKMFISGRTINTDYDGYKYSSIILSSKNFRAVVNITRSSLLQFLKKERKNEKINFSEDCKNNISERLIEGLDNEFYITTYLFCKDILKNKDVLKNKNIKSNDLLVCKFIQSVIEHKITNLIETFFNIDKRRRMCFIITAVNYDSKVFDKKGSKVQLKRNYRFETKELANESKSKFSENEIFITILQKNTKVECEQL